jgi:hypothetical protein
MRVFSSSVILIKSAPRQQSEQPWQFQFWKAGISIEDHFMNAAQSNSSARVQKEKPVAGCQIV